MNTLSQRRAAKAIEFKNRIGDGQQGGDSISGFPMLIKTDGLLAALAFAVEWKTPNERKHKGAYSIAQAIASHLQSESIVDARSPDDLVEEISMGDATLLRRATAETIAFLAYLKRFAQ